MKIMIALMMVLFMSGTGMALDLVESTELSFTDTVTVLNGEGGKQLMGVGSCYGNYYDLMNDSGSKVGGILSTCAILGVDVNDGSDDISIAMIGIRLVEAFGLSLNVAYDTLGNQAYWGISISMIQIGKRLGD